ncbi:ROK family protein [Roseivirga sp. BDSF3-8]|uniref:ROK family protein n=1 Tax=Roseivirga sp. BDSF3-8 TaxID=3241598 RepID=UPI003531BD79
MSKNNLLFGIDLGGTKIEGVALSATDPSDVVCRMRIDTEAHEGYEHILDRIKLLVSKMENETGHKVTALGIGTPGSIDPHSGLLKNSNTTVLNHKPFKYDLEKKLGFDTLIANDANCFALAEARLGAVPQKVPGAKIVFGVIMGTGVGGGIVINGLVLNGNMGIAGEWGHNHLDDSGGPCYCGKVGCVEKVLSGPSLERYYESESGEKRKLKEIVNRTNNDEAARKTIHRLQHFFGKGISVVINILDPDVIVLGGGVTNIDSLYSEGVKSAEEFVFNTRFDTPIIRPKLGDSAGVFGAALLIAD